MSLSCVAPFRVWLTVVLLLLAARALPAQVTYSGASYRISYDAINPFDPTFVSDPDLSISFASASSTGTVITQTSALRASGQFSGKVVPRFGEEFDVNLFFTALDGTSYSIEDPKPFFTSSDIYGDPGYTQEILVDNTGTYPLLLYASDSGTPESGSAPTGTLIAGHTYFVAFITEVGASASNPSPSTVTWNPAINFTPATPAPAPTPEPSSLVLLGTGLAGMAATLRRRLRGRA